MSTSEPKIAIIGAGLSGLVAAICLEEQGFAPEIFEASDSIGGRIKTDFYEGIPLDHGFQVLLTEYPLTKKYLDYGALGLKHFLPGALLYRKGKTSKIGDPLRNATFLFSTVFSGVGSIQDKWKIFRLSSSLKNKSIAQLFEAPGTSTLDFLKEYGFSDRIIDNFFRPFFSGIFLEDELTTSSRMFQFVYKMFSEGDAAIPEKGMQEIPKQLYERLWNTKIHYNRSVARVDGKTIHINGDILDFDAVIIATDPTKLLEQLSATPVQWHSSHTLYFKTKASTMNLPIIGLLTKSDTLVNNLHFVTDVIPVSGSDAILSATVVRAHELSETDLVARAKKELLDCCKLNDLEFIRGYRIDRALPKLKTAHYESRLVKYSDHVFLAGDHLANGSINAAMLSGEQAASETMKALEQTK
ncbi:FAD-dependent oxidoreductase [Flavobacteriaceae bacterium TP-CH-4]|uniref:FAD-dependent oxidoreductase n=1 Tax=Pelagihabitans pacificus TaxID=2696054 RepID=A0A967AUY8_9FLAO|nr:NAD(P)/FAD-dependent oxidoreductase [Pelagihabitans pacificus]NHF59855.1 FAD-dependent oxidoreductase [Pelagihabitans pacificus]